MMTALYRRYRPDTFEDVIGQEHVTKALQASLANGRINHAYLFSGPRGCGKTTSARIMARCLNCAEGPTPTPCGKCDSCRDLATGGPGSLDVIEIDAASHGGVDDTRELRDRAAYAPARDRFKIFIIDEAHNVSKEGFNALLKLVEEPPEHIKFIFATTNPEKVISTIRSRTHHYPFRLVAPETLRDYMAGLCRAEGVTPEDGVLGLVVRAGGGSVRDSLSILDQLMAGEAEPTLHYDRAVSLLGYTDSGLLSGLVDGLVAGSGAKAYAVVDRMIQSGNEPRRFVEDLLQYWRNLVVMKLAGEGSAKVLGDLPEAELSAMRPQADALAPRTLTRCAELVDEGLTEMVGATSPRLTLELLVAKLLMETTGEPTSTVTSGNEGATFQSSAVDRTTAPARNQGHIDSVKTAQPAVPPVSTPSGASARPASDAIGGPETPTPQRSVEGQASGPEPATKTPSQDEKWEFKPTPWDIPGESPAPALDGKPTSAQDGKPAPAQHPAPEENNTTRPRKTSTTSTNESRVSGENEYEKIRSNWGKILARLQQDHAATGNLVGTHGQLQGIREGFVEIAFPNPGLVHAFGDRHTSAVSEVIHGFTGLNVRVRGVVAGFGAPQAAQPHPAPESGAVTTSVPKNPVSPTPPAATPSPAPHPDRPEDAAPVLEQPFPAEPPEDYPQWDDLEPEEPEKVRPETMESYGQTPTGDGAAGPAKPDSTVEQAGIVAAGTDTVGTAVPGASESKRGSGGPGPRSDKAGASGAGGSQSHKPGIETAKALLGGTIIDPEAKGR